MDLHSKPLWSAPSVPHLTNRNWGAEVPEDSGQDSSADSLAPGCTLPVPPFWMSSLGCRGGAAGWVAALSRVAVELTRHLGVRPSPKHRLARISCRDPELSWESLAPGRQGLSLPPVGISSPKAREDQSCGKSCAVMNLVVRRAVSALRAHSFLLPNQNTVCVFPFTHLPRRFCLAPVLTEPGGF